MSALETAAGYEDNLNTRVALTEEEVAASYFYFDIELVLRAKACVAPTRPSDIAMRERLNCLDAILRLGIRTASELEEHVRANQLLLGLDVIALKIDKHPYPDAGELELPEAPEFEVAT